MTSSSHQRPPRAFTLMELVIVIAIIISLTAVGAFMIKPSTSTGTRSGMVQLEGFIAEARAEALSRNQPIRLGFVTAGGDESLNLRGVVQLAFNGTDWIQQSKTRFLPTRVYFDTANTLTFPTMNATVNQQSVTLSYATFQANGFCEENGQQITIAAGRTDGTNAIVFDPNASGAIRLTRIGTSPEIAP